MTRPTEQTTFMPLAPAPQPLASGPQQPAYWQPPTSQAPANGGWGQPADLWTGRPVSPVQDSSMSVPPGTLDTGGRRPPERRTRLILVLLLAVMTIAAGVLGTLYVVGSSSAADELASANAATATAEDELDEAKTTAQNLQACQQASKDLIVALNGDPNAQATTDAATDALNRIANSCQ